VEGAGLRWALAHPIHLNAPRTTAESVALSLGGISFLFKLAVQEGVPGGFSLGCPIVARDRSVALATSLTPWRPHWQYRLV
jgi:hypothetical protein